MYKRTSVGGRVLLSVWSLLSLVTVATYTGKLTSDSMVTRQRVPFNSLHELVKRTDYRWGLIKGTMTETLFAVSTYVDHLPAWQKNEEEEESNPDLKIIAL